MYYRLLAFFCVWIQVHRLTVAQLAPCPNKWQTTESNGAYWIAGGDEGMTCSPSIPNSCRGGPNAVCSFSYRTFSYRCCHDVWLPGVAGPPPTGLLAASNAGLAKPLCPYGAKGFSSQPMPCDRTNINSCPSGYTCTKAVNRAPAPPLTVPSPIANAGACGSVNCYAYLNPYVCCQSSTLPGSMAKIFAADGITPTIVPIAPTGAIHEVVFGTGAAAITVNHADDMSPLKSLFITATSPQTGLSTSFTDYNVVAPATAAAAGELFLEGVSFSAADVAGKFHVLFFGLAGGVGAAPVAATAEKFAYPPRVKLATATKKANVAPGNGAVATRVSGVRKLDTTTNAYFGPADFLPIYKVGVLAGAPGTGINDTLGTPAAGGPLDPVLPGTFTTVTNFLKGDYGKILGPPIAGTYFYV